MARSQDKVQPLTRPWPGRRRPGAPRALALGGPAQRGPRIDFLEEILDSFVEFDPETFLQDFPEAPQGQRTEGR